VTSNQLTGRLLVTVILSVATASGVRAEGIAAACGSLENMYGPFDYVDPVDRADKLPVVEAYHFTPDVEQLRRGKSSSSIANDIDYTLRAFPNHHRALNSLATYVLRGGRMGGAHYSVDCYFDRAIRWRPEDPVVRMIYANFLQKRKDADGARAQFETALKLAPTSPEVNYNAGLFFFQQGNYSAARECAHVAYAGGYPLPGLKNKLIQAGHWNTN
jgi:hypothetical protein